MNKGKSKTYLFQYLLLMILTIVLIITIKTSESFVLILEFFYYLFMFLFVREIAYTVGIIPRNGEKTEIVKLSTKEANAINFKQWRLREPLHSERIDNATGTDYEATIVKNKDGTEIFIERERYGGMYYFGSLISVIILVGFIGIIIYGSHINFVEHNITGLIITFFIIPFMFVLFVQYNQLIADINEKKTVKQEIREGIREKDKITIPMICYRIMVFSFTGLMAAGFIATLVKNLPEIIQKIFGLIAYIGVIGFVVGFILYVTSSIVAYIISLIKH